MTTSTRRLSCDSIFLPDEPTALLPPGMRLIDQLRPMHSAFAWEEVALIGGVMGVALSALAAVVFIFKKMHQTHVNMIIYIVMSPIFGVVGGAVVAVSIFMLAQGIHDLVRLHLGQPEVFEVLNE